MKNLSFQSHATLATIVPADGKPYTYNIGLGNGSAFLVLAVRTPSQLILAINTWGSVGGMYTFRTNVSAGYVAEKLGLKQYLGDAELFARWINTQLDAPTCGHRYAVLDEVTFANHSTYHGRKGVINKHLDGCEYEIRLSLGEVVRASDNDLL